MKRWRRWLLLLLLSAVWEAGARAGGGKMDKTLANWLHQTVLELRTAISHWTVVCSWLRRLQICTEYINERSESTSHKFLA